MPKVPKVPRVPKVPKIPKLPRAPTVHKEPITLDTLGISSKFRTLGI